MADALRNEVAITLAGSERTMRATFTAIRAIEAAVGKSLIALIGQVGASGDLSITDAVTVIYHGLRGADDKRLTLEQVGDAVMEAGYGKISIPVIEFLSAALKGVSLGKPEPTAAQ